MSYGESLNYNMTDPPPQDGGPVATDVWGAIALAGASAYDTYQGSKTSKRNTDKTISANKSEAELAYQRNLEMWNLQNAYNSPAAQMARFKEAGLNPHLMYGQGTPGNAQAPPAYSPPDIQYKYEAPQYGAAIGSILPTLMSVGSWMQDMRLKEAQLIKVKESTEYNTIQQDQLRQLITYLEQKNPRALKTMDNSLSLFPYQYSIQESQKDIANTKASDLLAEFEYKHGHYEDYHPDGFRSMQKENLRLKNLQEFSKSKLLDAQSAFTDFDITNPQAIMQLVLSGVMGMAGKTLSFNRNKRSVTHETETRMRGGRTNFRRRIIK